MNEYVSMSVLLERLRHRKFKCWPVILTCNGQYYGNKLW